jgi:hypothetical protein
MALYTQYDTVGLKEDVSDIITNLSPTETPFQSMIGSEKVTQKNFQWQEDSLRAQATNAQVEGFTASDVTITPTTMRSAYTQILAETIKVSGSMDNADTYGRAKESAYQIAKSMQQVKRDFEYALVGSAQAGGAGSNVTARTLASFQAQLHNGGTGSLDADDFVLYTGGTSTLPTEANFLSLLNHLFTYGGDPTVIMVTPTNSQTVADFAKAAGRYRTITSESSDKDQRTITNVVDLYVSPYGQQRVVINRFLKDKNTLFFRPDMWKKAAFRTWFRETLAKTGDNTSMMIVGEYGLKHKHKQASGAIVEAAGATGF